MYGKTPEDKKNQITNKEIHLRISVDFSMEFLEVRRARNKALKVLKDCASQPRLMYTAKLSDIAGEEGKSLHNINSLKNNYIQQVKPKENTGRSIPD